MAEPKPIGYWLKLVDQLIDEQFASTLDEHGVTRRQWQLLNVLSKGPATLSELDAAVAPFLNPDVDETSAEHLDELVESEWVTLAAGSYQISERGMAVFTKLAGVVAGNREMIAQGISEEAYAATITTLEHMARNLGWTG